MVQEALTISASSLCKDLCPCAQRTPEAAGHGTASESAPSLFKWHPPKQGWEALTPMHSPAAPPWTASAWVRWDQGGRRDPG